MNNFPFLFILGQSQHVTVTIRPVVFLKVNILFLMKILNVLQYESISNYPNVNGTLYNRKSL